MGTIEGAHADGVWAAQFAPCGKLIATVGQDGKTKVWDAETRELLATYGRHRGVVHTARFNKDSTVLATGGRDGTIRIWAVECRPK
jgi:WD40 repeat protein